MVSKMWGAIIGAIVAIVGGLITANQQEKSNMDMARFQADANEDYLAKQLDYNSPKNQMMRFQEAGLNPHLVYGQGSPGNQQAPLSFPDVKVPDLSRIVPEAQGQFNQGRLIESQVQAQEASTRQKHALTALNKLQAQVLARNPLLDDAGFNATIDGLKATAELKAAQAGHERIRSDVSEKSAGHVVAKVFHEVELLSQRFQLGQQDAKIKAEILKSKEFQNAILEVQKKFMTDAEVTPQHILQFIQLLLMKAL